MQTLCRSFSFWGKKWSVFVCNGMCCTNSLYLCISTVTVLRLHFVNKMWQIFSCCFHCMCVFAIPFANYIWYFCKYILFVAVCSSPSSIPSQFLGQLFYLFVCECVSLIPTNSWSVLCVFHALCARGVRDIKLYIFSKFYISAGLSQYCYVFLFVDAYFFASECSRHSAGSSYFSLARFRVSCWCDITIVRLHVQSVLLLLSLAK